MSAVSSWTLTSLLLLVVLVTSRCVDANSTAKENNATTSPLPHSSSSSSNLTTLSPTQLPLTSPQLTASSYLTIVVVVLVLVALVAGSSPCAVMFCAGLLLRLANAINTTQLFAGLSETGVVTIAMLFIVVAPLPHLPLVRRLIALLLDGKYQLFKLCIICYTITWCTGNVPLVVLLLPIVKSYCHENKIAPSQMLMSMNVASLLGGSFSVIGTSTNLVYSSLMKNQGIPSIPFFEMAKISLLPAIIALGYLAVAPKYLLSKKGGDLLRKLRDNAPTFVAQFRVLPNSPLVGKQSSDVQEQLPKSVVEAVMIIGVRGANGDSEITASPRRNRSGGAPPVPATPIQAGDRIVIAGSVVDLHVAATLLHMSWEPKSTGTTRRVEVTDEDNTKILPLEAASHIPDGNADYFEVVIGNNCPSIGRLVGEGVIDLRYSASLLSLRRRDGQDLVNEDDIASHALEVGDTLLLLAPDTLPDQFGTDFFVISQLQVPQHVHPFIIEVPDACCIGRYVSVDTSSGSHHGGGADDGQRHRSPLKRLGRTAVDTDGEKAGGQAMTELETRFHFFANDDDDDDKNVMRTKKVIVLPDSYRNVALLVFIGMVAASVSGVPIEISTACAATLLVVLRLVPLRDALRHIDVELLVTISFSFTIGTAITVTNVAAKIAEALEGHGLQGLPLFFTLSFFTMFFTNAITAKACAQVMVPITVALCRQEGIDPFPACMLLTCATASSIATPYGHPSNLLIFGPGGYKARHFVKFGLPLNIFLCAAMAIMTSVVYDQW